MLQAAAGAEPYAKALSVERGGAGVQTGNSAFGFHNTYTQLYIVIELKITFVNINFNKKAKH